MFERVIEDTGAAAFDLLERPVERLQYQANVRKLGQMLDEFARVPQRPVAAQARRAPRTLHSALDYLELMEKSGTEAQAEVRAQLDGVELSTIHGAKGREWEHVYVPACVDGKLPGRRRPDKLSLPGEFLTVDLSDDDAHFQEELHLFYVAGSRARTSLTYSWARHYGDSAEKKRSRFLDLVPSELTLQIDDDGNNPPLLPRSRILPELLPDGRLNLSYTTIWAYKRMHESADSAISVHRHTKKPYEARLGIMVHDTLRDIMQLKVGGAPVSIPLAMSLWDRTWEENAEDMRQSPHDLKHFGAEMIERYMGTPAYTDATPRMIESAFEMNMGDNIVLRGRFDRVDLVNGKYVVVDYKTGVPPQNDKSLRYDDQMVIYALAIQDLTGAQEVTCEKHFLQGGEVHSVTYSAQQLARNRERITKLCHTIKEDVLMAREHGKGAVAMPRQKADGNRRATAAPQPPSTPAKAVGARRVPRVPRTNGSTGTQSTPTPPGDIAA